MLPLGVFWASGIRWVGGAGRQWEDIEFVGSFSGVFLKHAASVHKYFMVQQINVESHLPAASRDIYVTTKLTFYFA